MKYLDLTLPTVEANLALDEALLAESEEGDGPPVLRFWEQPDLAVVLGASCRFREDVHGEACRADGVVIARRSSGGGTVVIGPGALNVTVVLPLDAAPGLGAVDVAQRYVLDRIGAALRALGPPVTLQGSGDLTLGLRKFSGSAQRRLRRRFLVHASLLYRFPLEQIARYTALPRRQPSYREGRSHAEFLINLGLPCDQIRDAIRAAWLPPDHRIEPATVPEQRVRDLIATKFGDPAWIYRL
ncbi:MAG: lipoate--protein ligase family protein [Isosphaeraceae bacterium]|nr:lipoate--protein ligase family protein [Isosphaeraceae bacterium]